MWRRPQIARPRAPDITSGLIANWPMTDAQVSGTTITDTVGGLNATMNDSANFSSAAGPGGELATARQTNGSGYATYTGTTLRNWSTGSFTVCGWFYMGDLSPSADGSGLGQRLWVDNRNSGTTEFMEINEDTTNGRLRLLTDNGRRVPTATGGFAAGEWHHFAYVNAGGGSSGTMTVYLDAAVLGVTTDTAGGGWNTNEGIFFDGSTLTGGANGRMNSGGRLCGMRAYNRPLAALDIRRLYDLKT